MTCAPGLGHQDHTCRDQKARVQRVTTMELLKKRARKASGAAALLAASLLAALFAVLMIPVSALAQGDTDTCDGQTVTVDLALGQAPTAGDDVIMGTDGPDAIAGREGDDVICGRGGDDIIYGQAGDDIILGGDGNDKLRGGPGNDRVDGGNGADDLSGSSGDDMVQGQDGDDTKVRGGTGNDMVSGGDGNDALVAGNGGDDQVFGGDGNDKVTGGPRPDLVEGGGGDDFVRGGGGADQLSGGRGNDQIYGGKQRDHLDGGTGADLCHGGFTGEGATEEDSAINCEDLLAVETVLVPTPTATSTAFAPAPPGLPLPSLPASEGLSDGSVSSGDIDPLPPGVVIPPPAPGPNPQPGPGLLTAADIDDNLNFDFFERYLSRQQQNLRPTLPNVNLSDRLAIRLVDQSGAVLSNAGLSVGQADGEPAQFFTSANAEGLVYLFPKYSGLPPATVYSATVTDAATALSTSIELRPAELNGETATDFTISVSSPDVERRGALDVAFVIDATGSMGDEMAYLKAEFTSIVAGVKEQYPDVDMQFALIVYRDIGDSYVTRSFDFGTATEMLNDLEQQFAAGGGDRPEAMETALQLADTLSWRSGDVSRVVILNADAPPHDENFAAALAAAEDLRRSGVRIYPLAASGVDDYAEFLMRVMAATTGGRHLFLTDDSGIGNSHQEPVVACYVVTALDDLLERVLATELAGERIEPDDDDIVRTVGDYDNGVCGDIPLPTTPTPTPTPLPFPVTPGPPTPGPPTPGFPDPVPFPGTPLPPTPAPGLTPGT